MARRRCRMGAPDRYPETAIQTLAEVGAVGPTAPVAHPAAPAWPQVASGRRDLLLPAPHRLFSMLLPLSESQFYGEAEAFLQRSGKSIPTVDLLIGLTAKQHGLPLLTADDEHFRRIPGLVVETY